MAQKEAENTEKHEKQHNIFVTTYKMHETMFTDQTDKFPHIFSCDDRHKMVLHKIDSNSSWIDPMKNRTKGEMILARGRALIGMKLCGIVPRHQVLDNEASTVDKEMGFCPR